MGRHVAPLEHIIQIPSKSVFALTPVYTTCLVKEHPNTNFIVRWFELTGARTHDLQQSRRARWPMRVFYANKIFKEIKTLI